MVNLYYESKTVTGATGATFVITDYSGNFPRLWVWDLGLNYELIV